MNSFWFLQFLLMQAWAFPPSLPPKPTIIELDRLAQEVSQLDAKLKAHVEANNTQLKKNSLGMMSLFVPQNNNLKVINNLLAELDSIDHSLEDVLNAPEEPSESSKIVSLRESLSFLRNHTKSIKENPNKMHGILVNPIENLTLDLKKAKETLKGLKARWIKTKMQEDFETLLRKSKYSEAEAILKKIGLGKLEAAVRSISEEKNGISNLLGFANSVRGLRIKFFVLLFLDRILEERKDLTKDKKDMILKALEDVVKRSGGELKKNADLLKANLLKKEN